MKKIVVGSQHLKKQADFIYWGGTIRKSTASRETRRHSRTKASVYPIFLITHCLLLTGFQHEGMTPQGM